MPKIVDHEERRRVIAAATMRVIARVGLEATTVREIAREAGVSNGVLAHYFANKQQILVTAHRVAFAAVGERIHRHAEAVTDPVDLFRLALQEASPLDQARMLEANIDVTFWGYALHDPQLRAVRTESHQNAARVWAGMVGAIRDAGRTRPGISPDAVAVETCVLVDGISAEAVLFPDLMTAERQLRLIDDHIAGILRPS